MCLLSVYGSHYYKNIKENMPTSYQKLITFRNEISESVLYYLCVARLRLYLKYSPPIYGRNNGRRQIKLIVNEKKQQKVVYNEYY